MSLARAYADAAVYWLALLFFPLIWTAAFLLALPFNALEGNGQAFQSFAEMFLSRRSWADWVWGLAHPVRSSRR